MTIAVYGSRRQESHLEDFRLLLENLSRQGIDVVMHENIYSYLLHIMPVSLGCVKRVVRNGEFTADLALSIGGDGTFLRAAAWVGDKQIPTLGVNTGHLGYLTSVSLGEVVGMDLSRLTDNEDFMVDYRTLVCVTSPEIKDGVALNDVAFFKHNNGSMIVAEVSVDGRYLAHYRSDGLLIATPTGSTAYNLSTGGPIVAPATPALVISPIAAHTLSMRPVVVPDDVTVKVRVTVRNDSFRIALDGRNVILPDGTEVTVSKAPYRFPIIEKADRSFASTLRTKLNWGVDALDEQMAE